MVAFLRNHLERRLDAKGIINIHQHGTKIHSERGLDIVRHQSATGCSLGPEPDKRDLLQLLRPHRQQQYSLHQTVDRPVDRPMRKWDVFPPPKRIFWRCFRTATGRNGRIK